MSRGCICVSGSSWEHLIDFHFVLLCCCYYLSKQFISSSRISLLPYTSSTTRYKKTKTIFGRMFFACYISYTTFYSFLAVFNCRFISLEKDHPCPCDHKMIKSKITAQDCNNKDWAALVSISYSKQELCLSKSKRIPCHASISFLTPSSFAQVQWSLFDNKWFSILTIPPINTNILKLYSTELRLKF